MALLGRLLALLLIVLLVSWAIWLARRVRFWMDFWKKSQKEARTEQRQVALRRDPMCGTFVSPEISFTLEHAGQVHHFCSAECRERFKSSLPRTASG